MKNIIKLIFSILLIFVFNYNIKASVVNCNNGGKITLTELSQASPAGFSVSYPGCTKYVPTNEKKEIGPYKTSKEAADVEKLMHDITVRTVDDKGNRTVKVPVCNNPEGDVRIRITCSYRVAKLYDIETKAANTSRPEISGVKRSYGAATKISCSDYTTSNSCTNNGCTWSSGSNTNTRFDKFFLPVSPFGSCSGTATNYVCSKGHLESDNECHYCSSGEYISGKCYGATEYSCDDGYTLNDDNECERKYCPDGWTSNNVNGCYKDVVPINGREYPSDYKTQGQLVKKDQLFCESEREFDRNSSPDSPCTCDVDYYYSCPLYQCETGIVTTEACTPKFQTADRMSAYCVNPSDTFSSTSESTAEYQVDSTFNINNCSSSYSTVDCGYANILIEGQYNNVSDESINLALRLWGAHSGQSGFDRVGLSLVGGSTCSSSVSYGSHNGKVINVYKATHDYIMSHFFTSVRNKDYLSAKDDFNLFSIACVKNESLIGVTCGENNIYKKGVALFLNTLLGNPHMKSHLKSLYGNELNSEPENAKYVTEDGKSYVVVEFDETEFEEIFTTTKKGEVIDCKKLKTTDPNYDKIKPFCEVKAQVINSEGKVLSEGEMDECIKGSGCRRETKLEAICDIEDVTKRPTTIKVISKAVKSSTSVKKFVSCSNPSASQYLFAFYDKDTEISATPTTGTPEVAKNATTNDFPITNYICAGSCTDYNTRETLQETCTNDQNNYDGYFKSNVQDPSLKCILNLNSTSAKDMYDYSDYFKVNKNICRIYCSDEVEYYIADKVKATSGRYFKFDIDSKVNGRKTTPQLLTSVVKEKRSCVSEIYYGRIPIPDKSSLKKTYGLTNEELNSVTNWTSLYSVLFSKSAKEGSRAENINQIIYDLYNCNLYDNKVFTDNGVTKPKENETGNLREYITNLYSSSNNYGLSEMSDCKVNTSTGENTCVTHNDTTYAFGAETAGKTASYKSVTTTSNTFDSMVYCSGSDCFKYDNTTNDALSYEYPKMTDSSTTNKQIGNKTTTYTISSSNLINWFGGKNKITIPTNDYVTFEVSTEVGFYNDSKYQTEQSTGLVIKPGSKTGNFLELEEYSYPLSKTAYNDCTKTNNGYNRCTIIQELGNVATFYRKNLVDQFASKVYSTKKFTCYVDVAQPATIDTGGDKPVGGESVVYRNVDPSNLFPNNIGAASNWSTAEGQAAQTQIESTSNLLVTDELLEYRITLTPTQIKNLKSYSQIANSYIDEELVNCSNDGTRYYDCQSTFMNMLRESSFSGNPQYGTLDQNYSIGVSRYSSNKK